MNNKPTKEQVLMLQAGKNLPFDSDYMKRLPKGFTPSAVFPTKKQKPKKKK